jgi:hypothetical protein
MSSATQPALSDDFDPLCAENYTLCLSSSVALRVYSNTKPCNLKIANLQKGLVFVHDGIERVGEGAGFGFPVLMYEKDTYFSGSATVSITQEGSSVTIRKEFFMDRIARNKFRNVHLQNGKARTFIKYLTLLYQKNRNLRFLFLKEFLLNFGFEAAYIKVIPIGKLVVTFNIHESAIDVKVDYSNLRRKHLLRRLFILNEQSANFFRTYSDADRGSLIDKKIGAWEPVASNWACLMDQHRRVGYRLREIRNSVLRRGRETMRDCLDWAGLDYEVTPIGGLFEYEIELLGVKG